MQHSIIINQAKSLQGVIRVPGDKSISHRALIFAALAAGKSIIKGISECKDCSSTLNCLKNLGIKIKVRGKTLVVYGKGLTSFKKPKKPLDCGNSGTTMRLLSGILAAQNFSSTLTGDRYLKKRPMKRIVEPLRNMGAEINADKGNYPPLRIKGKKLQGINYHSPIASAQIKNCLLLAGLQAEGTTTITEPFRSRDHSERMLKYLGVPLKIKGTAVSISRAKFQGKEFCVPGDISSAAFFIAAAVILSGSKIKISGLGLNPTRTGFLDVLKKMGAKIEIENKKKICGEPVANLEINGKGRLKAIKIGGKIIPRIIDEIPLLAVIGCFAQGKTIIRDAGELRVKETDRIHAIVSQLKKMGASIEERKDGMEIFGRGKLKGASVKSFGDHRIAMALVIAGLAASGKTKINNTDCINTSFPGFEKILKGVVKNE